MIFAATKMMEPFYRMARRGGASAEESLLADYLSGDASFGSSLFLPLFINQPQDGDSLPLSGDDGLNGFLQLADERAVIDAFGGADTEADSPQLGGVVGGAVALSDAQIIAV